MTNMLKQTRNTNSCGIRFKTSEIPGTENCFQKHVKNVKARKFLSQLPLYTSKVDTCKVLFAMTFGFMTPSVAPTLSLGILSKQNQEL